MKCFTQKHQISIKFLMTLRYLINFLVLTQNLLLLTMSKSHNHDQLVYISKNYKSSRDLTYQSYDTSMNAQQKPIENTQIANRLKPQTNLHPPFFFPSQQSPKMNNSILFQDQQMMTNQQFNNKENAVILTRFSQPSKINITDYSQMSQVQFNPNQSYKQEQYDKTPKNYQVIQQNSQKTTNFEQNPFEANIKQILSQKEVEITRLSNLLEFKELENQNLVSQITENSVNNQKLNQIITQKFKNELNDKENQISDLSVLLCTTKTQLQMFRQNGQQIQKDKKSEDHLNKLFLISLENERLHQIIFQYQEKAKKQVKEIESNSKDEINQLRNSNQLLAHEIRRCDKQREGDPLLFQELHEQLLFYKSEACRLNEVLMNRCRNQ